MKIGVAIIIFVLLFPPFMVGSGEDVVDVAIEGNKLFVGGSGPGNYSMIQDAIDHAGNGDTIFVYAGVYKENIEIYNMQDLTITGENMENTIIDGDFNNDDVVSIHYSNGIKIANFTIRNSGQIYYYCGLGASSSEYCEISNCKFENDFHGIVVYKSSHNKIKNCIFNDLQGQSILITVNSDYNEIKNCQFNYANWTGAYVYKSKENKIIDSTFYGCDTAITVYSSPNCQIKGATVYSCGSMDSVSLFIGASQDVILQNCNISESKNTGLAVSQSSNVFISDSSFVDDVAGIILYEAHDSQIENCTVSGSKYSGISIEYSGRDKIINTVSRDNGYHGILLYYSDSNEVKNCELAGNTYFGIDIYKGEGNNDVRYCTIRENKACGVYLFETKDDVINYNNIIDNGWGMFVNNSIADARYNYWGSVFGPLTFGLFGDGIWWTKGSRASFFPWALAEIK